MNIKQHDFYYKLRKFPFVETIWLYGSRAREEERARSDIDLAIFCPTATSEDWSKIQDIIEEADTLFHIDVVRFDTLSETERIRKNILNDGVVLFERKPNNYPWYESFLDLGEALEQLKDSVKQSEIENPYVREATIKRFEFSVELFWKTLKKICIYEDYDVTSPRSVLAKAFELEFIADEDLWIMMIKDRNLTSHTYKREIASEIYYKIKSYYPAMKKAYLVIQEKYKI